MLTPADTTGPRQITYAQAIAEALLQAMDADPAVFIMGIGVDDAKGIFGTTRPAAEKFGGTRVIEMPACENCMTGMALGMAMNGKRPVVVHARNDFSFLAMDQLFNYAAKWRAMFGGQAPRAPIVVRNIIGKGWGQGATHSQNLMAVYGHFPGLHVLAPSCARDAKGMLIHGLRGTVPTVIFEHRALYDHLGVVPENMFETPPGQARVAREGRDVSVIAVSWMVPEALKAAIALEELGVSAEVVDLRSVRPLDEETILRSVAKTGRALCADAGWVRCGVAAEIAAVIASSPVVRRLQCPLRRVGMADCPAPVSRPLEDVFYADHRSILAEALAMLGRDASAPYAWPENIETFKGPY